MTRILIGLALLLPGLAWGEPARVETSVGLTSIRIQAAAVVDADAATMWATLTDYDNLARFVPGMTLSRLVSAPDARPKLLEQRGTGGLIGLVVPDHVVFALEERPTGRIGFRSVSGAVSVRGEWVILGEQAPVRLGYRGTVVPPLPPPPMLTDGYVQSEIRLRMNALVREAERRMAARPPATATPAK